MSIIKNYIYNTLYQITVMFIPLITMPYLTRIFSPDQLGINSYTLSIVNYFVLFGLLGMQLYGNRQIAYVREDKEKLKNTFWSLYATQVITIIISIIIYIFFVGNFVKEYKIIYLIQGLNLITSLIDISWLFVGLEDFKKVSIRNMIVKVSGLIGIFIFVRSSDDLLTYIFITVLVNIIGMIVMWIYLPSYLRKISIDKKIIKKTIIPLLLLFIPQISSQIYMEVSRTMIGIFSNIDEVAFYDYSQKIVRILLTLVTSVGVVLMPRVSNMNSNGKKDEIKEFVSKAFMIISYISIPMAFGLMGISEGLISWFLGEGYFEVGKLAAISSIIIIPVSWASIIGVQYLIATKQENKYTLSVVISAILSLIINIILIPKLGALGAVISLVVAECTGSIIQLILVRKQIKIKNMILGVIKYFIVAIIMLIVIVPVGNIFDNKIIANIVQVMVGIVIYFGTMAITKDKIQNELIQKLTNIIRKKFNKL